MVGKSYRQQINRGGWIKVGSSFSGNKKYDKRLSANIPFQSVSDADSAGFASTGKIYETGLPGIYENATIGILNKATFDTLGDPLSFDDEDNVVSRSTNVSSTVTFYTPDTNGLEVAYLDKRGNDQVDLGGNLSFTSDAVVQIDEDFEFSEDGEIVTSEEDVYVPTTAPSEQGLY